MTKLTTGYGMAVLLLVASMNGGSAWLPGHKNSHRHGFTKSTKTTLTRLAPDHDDLEIAKAWNHVGDDLNRNDQAALEVLKELRSSLHSLEENLQKAEAATSPDTLVAQLAAMEAQEFAERESRISNAKAESEGVLMQAKWDQAIPLPAPEAVKKPEILQAHDIVDEEAARLVAQLATMEAMEVADYESMITAAKDASEGVLLQAKWDLQQAICPKAAKEVVAAPELLQAHDLVDEEAAQLVAELAAMDANEVQFKESLIDSAREASEAMTMHAKIDQQEATPVAAPEVPQVEIPQAHDLVDTEASKLVSELAALDANELAFKENLIDSARAASEGVTMNAKLDQQIEGTTGKPLQGVPPSIPDVTEHIVSAHDIMDEAAAQLVAELAAMDAAEFSARESLINTARDASVTVTMHAKIDQQQATPRAAKQVPDVIIPQAHDLVDQEASNLVAELAALDANEVAFKQSLIDSARAASEGVTMNAKLDQQEQFVMPAVEEVVEIPVDDEAAHLVAQLASQDAAELAAKSNRIDAARDASDIVTMEAKIDQQQGTPRAAKKMPEVVIPQAHDLVDEEAAQLVAQLAAKDAAAVNTKRSRIESAREASEMITMQAKIDQQNAYSAMAKKIAEERPATKKVAKKENERELTTRLALLKTQLASLEAAKFAGLVDTAKSNAVREDAVSTAEKAPVTNLEAAKFAVLVDTAKSNAVREDALSEAEKTPVTKKVAVSQQAKLLATKLASLEVQQFALQMDIAKSNAVKKDAASEKFAVAKTVVNEKVVANLKQAKQVASKLASLEAEQFAIQMDMQKSEAVIEDARFADPRVTAHDKATLAEAVQVIEPVVMAAEKITEAVMREEAVVEMVAEPFSLAEQNPNQVLEVIDVQALKSAAQEVQEASDMLSSQLPDSAEKEVIIRAAKEAAASVLNDVQAQQSKLGDKEVLEGIRQSNNMLDREGPTSLADENNNGFSARKAREISTQRMRRPEMLEPLPNDVTDYQQDAARYYYAKQAAEEIARNKDPEGYFFAQRTPPGQPKELTAAELAAKEHEEVDQQLKELFADVNLGFNQVKESLARLMNSDGPSDDMGGGRNSTGWGDFSP